MRVRRAIDAHVDDSAGVPLRVIAIDAAGEMRPALTLTRPPDARAWTDEGTFSHVVLAGPS